jgi:hypothetical protein
MRLHTIGKSLLVLCLITGLLLLLPIVGAVDKNFLGVVPPDSTEFPPKILFSTDPYNPTAPLTQFVYDASSIHSDITIRQNLTVPLCVKAGASEGRSTQLTNVSFTASWKKDPVILYSNPSIIASAQNLNPNAVHGIWMPTSYGDYFYAT